MERLIEEHSASNLQKYSNNNNKPNNLNLEEESPTRIHHHNNHHHNNDHEEKIKTFICLECKNYANEPILTYCGHMFCWKCLIKSIVANKNNKYKNKNKNRSNDECNNFSIDLKIEPQINCPYCKEICLIEDCYPVYIDSSSIDEKESDRQSVDKINVVDNNNKREKINELKKETELIDGKYGIGRENENNKDVELVERIIPSLATATIKTATTKVVTADEAMNYDENYGVEQQEEEEPNSYKITIPPRPAAKHRNKVLNPNVIGAGLPLASNDIPSNISLKKMVPGYVSSPSTGVQIFNSIEEGEPQDEDVLSSGKFKVLMHFMVVVLILAILWAFLE